MKTKTNHKHLGAINHYDNIQPKPGDSEFMKILKEQERERLKNESKLLTDEDFWR